MTNTELVIAGRHLYESIIAISFSTDEMMAFGEAVFSKTPWSALTPPAKIAMFRLAAALAALAAQPTDPAQASEHGPIPDAEIVDTTATESPSAAELKASEGVDVAPLTDDATTKKG